VKAFFTRSGDNLIPKDAETMAYVSRRKPGEVIVAEIKIARNYENHKRFFAFLDMTFGMQEHFEVEEAYRKWLTMKCGYFDTIVAPNGKTIFIAKSISFENMPEDEFQKLFSTAIDIFLKEFGNGLSENDILQAIGFS